MLRHMDWKVRVSSFPFHALSADGLSAAWGTQRSSRKDGKDSSFPHGCVSWGGFSSEWIFWTSCRSACSWRAFHVCGCSDAAWSCWSGWSLCHSLGRREAFLWHAAPGGPSAQNREQMFWHTGDISVVCSLDVRAYEPSAEPLEQMIFHSAAFRWELEGVCTGEKGGNVFHLDKALDGSKNLLDQTSVHFHYGQTNWIPQTWEPRLGEPALWWVTH